MLLYLDLNFVNQSEPEKLSEREKLRLLGYVAVRLYYKSRKAFGSELTSPPRAQEAAHRKQQQTESSIGAVQRSRVRHVPERETRRRASKRQIKHQPIPPHPVYKRLRFQVCQDYPQVSQRVPPLCLEGVTEQIRKIMLVQ